MCGITGVLELKGTADLKLVWSMMACIRHRGPDQDGVFSDGSVALGMKRLNIIDLKTGKQPIYTSDKNMVIFYNGEIYNYKELRAELEQKGHTFSTKSDTEVALHMVQ